MLDLKAIREDPEPYRIALSRRGVAADLDRVLGLDEEQRSLKVRVEDLRAEQNRASKDVGRASPEDRQRMIESLRGVSDELKQLEPKLQAVTDELTDLLARLPNVPHESVPPGESDEDNEEVRVVGKPASLGFAPRDHVELGESLGALDVQRGVRTSGARFAYLTGPAVWLQFALVRYALDLLAARGFVPVIPPVLVREEALFGSGFLPGGEAQIYATREDDLYLVGTAEVPLASLHRDEILEAGDLPRRYAGYSSCFRREAGTYGKDMRGIFRVHQFDKVEMFSFVTLEQSWGEHEFLVSLQEELVGGLELPYRVVNVCVAELGDPYAKKIDLEAWLPGQGRYRELTSCSNATDYQSRRLATRYRTPEGNRPVHTLNGTATAIGRTIIAILENHQREDGSVAVPESLWPYLPESLRVLEPRR
jgi:seryl-tRNA synthetase